MQTIAPARSGHPRALLAVLLVAPFLASVDATIANVATPAIRTSLGASGAEAELVVGGYLVAYAMLLITGARMGQTHGYKRLFLIGVALFATTSVACGLAPDAGALIAARVVQGGGAAMMFPQTMTGIQLHFDGRARTRAIGLYAIALSAGAVIGQIAGGVLISADIAGTGWRAIFLVNVPVCAAVIAAAIRWLPADAGRGNASLDLAGTAVLAVSVLLVMLPLTLGHDLGWPLWTRLCLAAAVPAFWLFLRGQRAAAAAGRAVLVNIAVVSRPRVLLGLISLAAPTATYFALLFTLAQYFQQGLGRSPLASGLILVPWVAAFGLAGQITGRLPGRLAPIVPVAGCVLLAAAYLAIGVALLTGHHGNLLLVALLACGGLGLGTQFATLMGHIMGAVPARFAPDISGVTSTTTQVGGALGVAGFGSLYLALAATPGSAHASHAFGLTSLALAVAAALAAVGAYLATHVSDDGGRPDRAAMPRHSGDLMTTASQGSTP
jgi:predicted MFS family arabinose efflux permease